MNKAFIFPGQGSQIVGMGKDFFDNFQEAKEIFQQVDDKLNYSLSKIIFDGPQTDLTLTKHTQPALMTVSMAIITCLIKQSGRNLSDLCNFTAGHSLGEYSALCASGAFSVQDAAYLLKIRGESMQNAAPAGTGAMAAILGLDENKITEIISEVGKNDCQIANDNVEGQIVVSGKTEAIDLIVAIAKDLGKKAIKLNVSAPFHSQLIKVAEEPMKQALNKVLISKPIVPVIANFTAEIETEPEDIKKNLINQICGTLRWRETMHKFSSLDVVELVEIGSGNVLSNLAKKSSVAFEKVTSITNLAEFDSYMSNKF